MGAWYLFLKDVLMKCQKKLDRLVVHVGGPSSPRNQAWEKCQDLINQVQQIYEVALSIYCSQNMLEVCVCVCVYMSNSIA